MSSGDPLPGSATVYRALRKSHLDPNQRILRAAFLLRPNESALSVTQSLIRAFTALRDSPGVADLNVGKIQNVDYELDVVEAPIPGHPEHAEIVGIPGNPYASDEDSLTAGLIADKLAGLSKFIPKP